MRNLVDPSIVESCSLGESLRCIHIGLLLVQDNPNARPLMPWVVSSLDNEGIELPQPREPVYFARRHSEPGGAGAGQSYVSDGSVYLTTGCFSPFQQPDFTHALTLSYSYIYTALLLYLQ
jgi:hypothetical protein